jgi:transposase-like protein
VGLIGYEAMRKKTVETRKDRQTFSEAFKADAVRMVMYSGKSMATVANSVGGELFGAGTLGC